MRRESFDRIDRRIYPRDKSYSNDFDSGRHTRGRADGAALGVLAFALGAWLFRMSRLAD